MNIIPIDIVQVKIVTLLFAYYLGLLSGLVCSIVVVKYIEHWEISHGKPIIEVVCIEKPTKRKMKLLEELRRGNK